MARRERKPSAEDGRRGWWTEGRRRRLRRWLIVAAGIIVASQWVRILLRPQGDFTLHWTFGQRLLDGTFLYESGMHRPYPPFWALASAPLTLLPMATMRALVYPLGLLPLVAVVVLVQRPARGWLPMGPEGPFWSTALGLALGSRFLIRELPECGANLSIVALAWAGIYLWHRGADRLGGVALGLAVALKCTPALLGLYFVWKRQWRLVGSTVVAAGVFTLSPIFWMGPVSYTRHMSHWLGHVIAGSTASSPLQGVLGDEEVHNLSLRPALGRYLVAVPPTHKGYLAHPWRFHAFDLPPSRAGWIVKGVMLALLAAMAAVMGRQIGPRDGLSTAWECAAVSILMLLYSPITWRQHCVWAVPALLLIARLAISRGLPWGMTAGVGAYAVLVLGLDRGVIGRDLTRLLDSYGVTAVALLALLAATLGGRALARRDEARASGLRTHAGASRPHLRAGSPRPAVAPAGTIAAPGGLEAGPATD